MTDVRAPLLLLHAFGAAGQSFAALAARLQDFDVHAPDLPGFGSAPPMARPTVDAYASWVERYVEREGLTQVVLGGWSMGGKIALAAALRRPPWLSGLVLIAPSPPVTEPMDEDDRRAQLDGFGDPALARRSITSLMTAPPPADELDAVVAARLAVSEAAWRWWLEAGSRETLAVVDPVAAPAEVVTGAEDPNLGAEVQRRLTLPALADATVRTIDRCGHFVPLEQPDVLARLVRDRFRRG